MTAERLAGEPVATAIRETVDDRVRALRERGVEPTLATVLVSDDPNQERFVELKHEACAAAGIATRDVRLAPDAPESRVGETVGRLSDDDAVDAVFVQAPLPAHVSALAVGSRLDPAKDVDGANPSTLGRLVAGDPQYVPATTAAVARLLEWYDYPVASQHVVVVGRGFVGRPLANHLLQRGPGGDATVTVCHSRTDDLATHTRRADVLVTTCGVPELVDESMLAPGVVVVDVSSNRRQVDGRVEVVGDVAYERARTVADAITPVPGGVGPVTLATLLENVTLAAERRAGVATDE